MNFFGHAVVAALELDDPRFVLGAMLPDLCGMAGLQLNATDDALIARGVAHHHRTDRAFHGCAAFVASCSSALATLEARGVGRASARAVGHVGSELLIDGALAGRVEARRAYAAALELARDTALLERVTLRGGARAQALGPLAARLAGAPIPERYCEPAFVHERLTHVLARRPRLALAESDHAEVRAWLEGAAAPLAAAADAIVDALHAQAG